MIRLILFIVVGLLAGLGGGSGFAVLRAKKSFAAQDAYRAKIVADSIAEGGERTAPAKHEPPKPDSSVAPDSAGSHVIANGPAKPVDSTAHAGTTGVAPGADAGKTGIAEAGRANSGAPNTAPPTGVTGGPSSAIAAKGLTGAAKPMAVPSAAPAVEGSAAAGGAASGVQPKRIGKIFAAMAPKDAAKVLAQLDNTDVQAILGSLNEKQAAAILTNFPPDRAAIISKNAMRGATKP